jgi:hypothetical protein
MSWSVQSSPDYTATHRLLCLRVVNKYFSKFDTPGMRYVSEKIFFLSYYPYIFSRLEIAQHHGPSGALSLALSLTASGSMGLDLFLRARYQAFVTPTFNYASSASILAASVVLKSRITVFKDLKLTGPFATVEAVQEAFEADHDRNASVASSQ